MLMYLIIIALLCYIFRKPLIWIFNWAFDRDQQPQGRRRSQFSEVPPPDKTGHERLVESEIWETFTDEFIYLMPRYGLLKGKKIPLDDITPEMMNDPAFVRPADLGTWLQRHPDGPR